MTTCPFCNLHKSRVVAENAHAKVVLSNPRLTNEKDIFADLIEDEMAEMLMVLHG